MDASSVVNLLYPPICLLCHSPLPDGTQVLCRACVGSMPLCRPPVCQRCGIDMAGTREAQVWCRRCRQTPLAFEKARAPFLYEGPVREAIHAFKYHGRRRVGEWLASQMAQTAQRELPLAAIERVMPVPMHWLKQRLKGMNPAAFLACAVAEILRLPYDPQALQRARWTPTQTRLTVAERARNVRGAFQARRRPAAIRPVLLVDDVFTSGATAHACALALHAIGVKQVSVLTAARAALDA